MHQENEGYGTEDEAERLSVSNELAVYLWENYIEYVYALYSFGACVC